MTTVILFVFGLILGSFLNVVGLRWPGPDEVPAKRVMKNLGGRSHCPECHKTLSWYELIPVLSFVIQRGKCRGCGTTISWQYPVIEILTGLIFVTVYSLQLTVLQNVLFLTVFCIYIAILIYDFHTKIIPDSLVYSAIGLSLVFRIASCELLAVSCKPVDLLAGPIIFLFFGSIWYFSKGRAIGFGDAKLGLSVGLLLGAAKGFSAIILSFWLGTAVAIFLLIRKGFTMKSEVPFAPFIVLGAWLAVVFNLDLLYVSFF
jgi:prepilin signal peptidase PulO-like enzyme (type II secretory pathway)